METIDPVLQKTVWARVLGTAPAPLEAEAPPSELLRLLEDERAAAASYRRLSRRLWGRDAALLRAIAEEARLHCQVLRAACYAESGQRADAPLREPSRLPPVPEALLAARNRETEAARDCEAAAERWPSYAGDLRAMAGDKRRRAQWLHILLGRLL